MVTGSTGAPQTLPPGDSISQFKVLTSSYAAEYGRTSGAIVTMITESGVNQNHGAAYGYFRNEDFDANNYFNNLRGQPRSEDRYNLFGGRIGGPLNIPKIYNGANKTFIFLNYEGLIQASPFSKIHSSLRAVCHREFLGIPHRSKRSPDESPVPRQHHSGESH